MKTNHETGARVILAVRENIDFARESIEWLLSKQNDDERAQGTSLHRNGEGLSKTHAAQLDMKDPSEMSHAELTAIACAYTHTQLAEAVETQELELPERNKRRRKNQLLEEDEEDEEDEEQQQEDEAREQHEEEERVECNYRGPVYMPSRALCERVATVVERLRVKDVNNDTKHESTWTPADVKRAIIEESKWMLGYVDIDDCVIDAALYYTLPALQFSPGNPPCGLIRIWWYSESVWANARVDRVSVTKGELRVDMTFPEESASGFVTGPDVLFAYEIK